MCDQIWNHIMLLIKRHAGKPELLPTVLLLADGYRKQLEAERLKI